uniref:Kinase n=2 Tax=Hirondellea gigas TaxID=1518452 RepID=A0A6A7FQ68_9CRUS
MTLGSMDHGEGSAAQLIKLEPLIHQVSGHNSLWVLDDVTVCKPLIGREARFYRALPQQMRSFTPEFRGTLKVLVQRTPEGVALSALHPLSSEDVTGSNDTNHSNTVRTNNQTNTHNTSSNLNSTPVDASAATNGNPTNSNSNNRDCLNSAYNSPGAVVATTTTTTAATTNDAAAQHNHSSGGGNDGTEEVNRENSNSATGPATSAAAAVAVTAQEQKPSVVPVGTILQVSHNPWLKQCNQRYLNKLKQKGEATSTVIECILLENLTHVYRVPNVLDLKMGTRQYGDDAPESKRRSQTRKAQHTTTPRLGVRLAGMQVYNRDTKCYTCKNKYVGRELTEEGFQQTLRHFLHNGRGFRTDIVEQIICKLTDLRNVVATLDSFRFFTASLLILYDSYDTNVTKSKDCNSARDKDRLMGQEKRTKSRDRTDRRRETLDASSSIEGGLNRSNSKESPVKDGGGAGSNPKREQDSKWKESCIQKWRDSSHLSSGKLELCTHDGDGGGGSCSSCGASEDAAATTTTQQKNKQRRSGSIVPLEESLSQPQQRHRQNSHDLQHRQRKHSHERQRRYSHDKQQHKRQHSHELKKHLSSDATSVSTTSAQPSSSPASITTSSVSSTSFTVSHSSVNTYTKCQGNSNSIEIASSETCSTNVSPVKDSNIRSNSSSNNTDQASGSSTNISSPVIAKCTSTSGTKVDIRLIDFAHATHKGMGDATIYSGPDDGLVLGLKSLIDIFTDIKDYYVK